MRASQFSLASLQWADRRQMWWSSHRPLQGPLQGVRAHPTYVGGQTTPPLGLVRRFGLHTSPALVIGLRLVALVTAALAAASVAASTLTRLQHRAGAWLDAAALGNAAGGQARATPPAPARLVGEVQGPSTVYHIIHLADACQGVGRGVVPFGTHQAACPLPTPLAAEAALVGHRDTGAADQSSRLYALAWDLQRHHLATPTGRPTRGVQAAVLGRRAGQSRAPQAAPTAPSGVANALGSSGTFTGPSSVRVRWRF